MTTLLILPRLNSRYLGAVAEVAWRYRVRSLGRFAANYRGLYCELPPQTLCGGAVVWRS
jgi:hypothetical protein